MKFILIGNYTPDRQESMKKYTENLRQQIRESGIDCDIWLPSIFFGSGQKVTNSGLGKWLGYIDKWILFPLVLKIRLLRLASINKKLIFHICDHSNAPYLKYLPLERTGITCHDVLAIRGALGFKDAYCDASYFGKILQKWILSNLVKAKTLLCVSKLTLNQLLELCEYIKVIQFVDTSGWTVIPNSYNAHFWPMSLKEGAVYLTELGLKKDESFILHVGSSLPRKNRKMLIDMVYDLGSKWNGKIYYAGQPIESPLLSYAKEKGIDHRLISIIKPSHEELVALYSTCEAFVFPSFSEGFGWPLIEAQACGAPVIASDVEPMPEVSNGSALHADPNKPNEFAELFLEILNTKRRTELIDNGFQNCKRFETSVIIKDFLTMYKAFLPTEAQF